MGLIDSENSISNEVAAEDTKLIVKDLLRDIRTETSNKLFQKLSTLVNELNLDAKDFKSYEKHLSTVKDLYAVHFESMDLSIENKKLRIFIGFGIDLNVQKSLLGFWLYDLEESPYHFWLKVCNQIKSSGVTSIEKKATGSFYWLEEAMNKVFS